VGPKPLPSTPSTVTTPKYFSSTLALPTFGPMPLGDPSPATRSPFRPTTGGGGGLSN
jgi:hypothetical protein